MHVPASIVQQTAQVIAQWQSEMQKSGLAPLQIDAASARFETRLDPFDQSENWFGEWRDRAGMKLGEISLRADGKVFCEYDVLRPHPHKPGWWIEAISSWGELGNLKSELRLLPVPA